MPPIPTLVRQETKIDLNGKIIKSGIINKMEGQLQSRIEFDVKPGIYILKIDTGNQLITRKIIKK